jgi:hypothetical protein
MRLTGWPVEWDAVRKIENGLILWNGWAILDRGIFTGAFWNEMVGVMIGIDC